MLPILSLKKIITLIQKELNTSTSHRNTEFKDSILLEESGGLLVFGSHLRNLEVDTPS